MSPRLLLLLALSATAAFGADLTIVRVFTGWREAASFKRISEYFDGREHSGSEIILRTHPDVRAGFYYLVRVRNPGAPVAARLNLHVITSGSARRATYSFAAGLKAGDTVLQLGLTGTDWTDPTANPVAWMLEVADADGHVLAAEKSYLWEKPADG